MLDRGLANKGFLKCLAEQQRKIDGDRNNAPWEKEGEPEVQPRPKL